MAIRTGCWQTLVCLISWTQDRKGGGEVKEGEEEEKEVERRVPATTMAPEIPSVPLVK